MLASQGSTSLSPAACHKERVEHLAFHRSSCVLLIYRVATDRTCCERVMVHRLSHNEATQMLNPDTPVGPLIDPSSSPVVFLYEHLHSNHSP